jgi:hypothetical protein
LKQLENARPQGCQPERAGQAKLQSGGLQRERRGAIFDERSHLFGATEVRLVNNARLAVNAGALDDVVVEMVAFFLGDEKP